MQFYRAACLLGLVNTLFVIGGEAVASPEEMDSNALSIAVAVDQAELLYGKNVSFLGTVTLKDSENQNMVVADASAGIWVNLSHLFVDDAKLLDSKLPEVNVGSQLRIWGIFHRGTYRPVLTAIGWRLLGQEELPPPPRADPVRFFRGEYDCERTRVSGLVERWREFPDQWGLVARKKGGKFTILIPKRVFPKAPDHYLGRAVDVCGVASGLFNTRGELVTPRVIVNDQAEVVLMPPNEDLGSHLPLESLEKIGGFRSPRNKDDWVRTQGVITFVFKDESIFIQDGFCGVIVDTAGNTGLRCGDRVEVVGQLNRRRSIAGITGTAIRVIEHPGRLEPTAISPAEIVRMNSSTVLQRGRAVPTDFFAALIRFSGVVYDLRRTQAGGTLLLDTGGCLTAVSMSRAVFLALQDLAAETVVEITGVTVPPENPATKYVNPLVAGNESFLQVLISEPSDLAIISRPPWWTVKRLTAVLLGAVVLLIGGLVWNSVLGARVTKQAARISRYVRSQTLQNERLRVARELHDTMEQDLACLMMKIDAEVSLPGAKQPGEFLQGIRRHLARIQAEAHDFLWDLRDPVRVGGNLFGAMASQVEYLQAMTHVPIRYRRQPGVSFVSPGIQHAILRIAREAVGNAIRHAAATQIDISIELHKGILKLEVADDGIGFEQSEVTYTEGHYGLIGMRERVEQIGGRLEIEASPGRGTTIRATILTGEPEDAGEGRGDARENNFYNARG